MDIKSLVEYINRRLPKNSVAKATLKEGFFIDRVLVEHPKAKNLGEYVLISKTFGNYNVSAYDARNDEQVFEATIKISGSSNDADIWLMAIIKPFTMWSSEEEHQVDR